MVFSFFKKDPKEERERTPARPAAGGRAAPKPVGRPLPGPVDRKPATTTARAGLPSAPDPAASKQLARTLAMETAAKIDAIESEMARDFMRPPGALPDSAANSTIQRVSQQPVTGNVAAAPAKGDGKPEPAPDPLDIPTDNMSGNALAIELHAEGGGSAIEEAAILFANGMADPAEVMLTAAVQAEALGDAARTGWLMLSELLNQRGDRAGFDALGLDYALRFENSPPAWIDYKDDTPAAGAAAQPALVRIGERVDASIVRPLEQLKALSQQHQSLTLDVSATRMVDLAGAELLLRVVNAFKRASHELIVLGTDQLVDPLRAAIEPGRRDPSDAGWMLLLEVYRLLNRQHDFEEAGIQYCITYEVSPPSWEPAPLNLKSRAAPPRETVVVTPADGLAWRGTIMREGEPHFGRLLTAAKGDKALSVDCTLLRRIEFGAATALLSVVARLRQGGATVELRNVNHLVGALLALLGVTAVATVTLRRA